MATAVGQRKRGRKKDALRTEGVALAQKAGNGTNAERTVDFIAGSKKDATVTIEIPRGAAFVPFALTAAKSDANARQTLANAIDEAGLKGKVAVHAYAVATDEGSDHGPVGTELTLWYLTGEAAPTTTRRPRRNKK